MRVQTRTHIAIGDLFLAGREIWGCGLVVVVDVELLWLALEVEDFRLIVMKWFEDERMIGSMWSSRLNYMRLGAAVTT